MGVFRTGEPPVRWMVYFMQDPSQWMMTGATPISGNPLVMTNIAVERSTMPFMGKIHAFYGDLP